MKSAFDWVNTWNWEEDGISWEGPSADFMVNFIKRIQADAIRGAVEEIRNGDTYTGRCDDLIPAIKLAEALE